MINDDILRCIAFPWLLFDKQGKLVAEAKGSLFELDKRSLGDKSFAHISSIRSAGWSLCPLGWAAYCIEFNNMLLVLPGLKIHSFSKVTGKADVLQIKVSKEYVERHVEAVINSAIRLAELSDRAIRNLIHEIRSVNSAVYNAAYELNEISHGASSVDARKAEQLSGNIVALSDVLSARLTAQDAITAFDAIKSRKKIRIPVYKKFDRLIKSFTPTAHLKEVTIKKLGSSYNEAYGPGLFEIVPFLLLENAIKYAFPKTEILCEFQEDDYDLICSVSSVGPQISIHEKEQIFLQGFRGKYALQTGLSGDGFGLAILKKTVEELYQGTVDVEINLTEPFSHKGILYSTNKFTCKLPIVD
jgi:signal transduction histidine kinase